MGDAIMRCTNEPGVGAIVDARGTYAAPPGPDWGWRIVIEPESRDGFRMLMFNITPNGEEALAVQATYSRRP